MPKKPKDKTKISAANIITADIVTSNGRVYPLDCIKKINDSINNGTKKLTIEEVNPIERNLNNINPAVSWDKHAMADSVSSKIENNSLTVVFETRNTKQGKYLEEILKSAENINYYPVGVGTCDANNRIKEYSISYVTFDLKKE